LFLLVPFRFFFRNSQTKKSSSFLFLKLFFSRNTDNNPSLPLSIFTQFLQVITFIDLQKQLNISSKISTTQYTCKYALSKHNNYPLFLSLLQKSWVRFWQGEILHCIITPLLPHQAYKSMKQPGIFYNPAILTSFHTFKNESKLKKTQ